MSARYRPITDEPVTELRARIGDTTWCKGSVIDKRRQSGITEVECEV